MGEIAEYFKQETLTEITQHLQVFRAQAQSLLAKIDAAEKLYNNMLARSEELGQAYEDLYNDQRWYINSREKLNAYSVINKYREQVSLNSFYLEGYRLLNEMGHYFHGNWNYTIVLFGQNNYTFQMNEEEFLSSNENGGYNYIEATATGFRLKAYDRTQSQLMAEQLMNVNSDHMIEQHAWDEEDMTSFKNYNYIINKARAILMQGRANPPNVEEAAKKATKVARYNRGQRTEGYLALMEQQQLGYLNTIAMAVRASVRHLGEAQFSDLCNQVKEFYNLLKEQTNTRGFWTGGDTAGHGQIKSTGATIFDFDTIRTQLLKVIGLFENIDLSGIEQNVENAQGPAANILNEKVQEVLSNIMAGFDATMISGGVQGFNSDLRADIQNLVDGMF